jgi:enoyl-CoA hydratase/carnithine racemase
MQEVLLRVSELGCGVLEEVHMTDKMDVVQADGVLTLRFNRPDALNAIHPEMLLEIARQMSHLASDVRVVVLTGSGRAFSAGVDLKVLQGIEPHAGKIGNVFDEPAAAAAAALRNAAVPVIAKVHGFCFTGALELALHCDLIYTTENTKFGDTHAKFGLRPTWGMTQTLSRAVGVRRAKELSYTARTFTGKEAHAWGLAQAATADEEALDELVNKQVALICSNSHGSVSAFKDLYALAQRGLPLEDALVEELASEYPAIADTQARLDSFGT